jgi:hypothetical protein
VARGYEAATIHLQVIPRLACSTSTEYKGGKGMSKLDDIKPTHKSGLYKVEIQVEGEWVSMALASKESVIKIADLLDQLSDEDVEAKL